MNPNEIEAALQTAFSLCNAAICPLTDMQRRILVPVVEQIQNNSTWVSNTAIPLDELTPEELEAFLEFVKAEEEQNCTWKVQLVNRHVRKFTKQSLSGFPFGLFCLRY